jgi:hypothetical protein
MGWVRSRAVYPRRADPAPPPIDTPNGPPTRRRIRDTGPTAVTRTSAARSGVRCRSGSRDGSTKHRPRGTVGPPRPRERPAGRAGRPASGSTDRRLARRAGPAPRPRPRRRPVVPPRPRDTPGRPTSPVPARSPSHEPVPDRAPYPGVARSRSTRSPAPRPAPRRVGSVPSRRPPGRWRSPTGPPYRQCRIGTDGRHRRWTRAPPPRMLAGRRSRRLRRPHPRPPRRPGTRRRPGSVPGPTPHPRSAPPAVRRRPAGSHRHRRAGPRPAGPSPRRRAGPVRRPPTPAPRHRPAPLPVVRPPRTRSRTPACAPPGTGGGSWRSPRSACSWCS